MVVRSNLGLLDIYFLSLYVGIEEIEMSDTEDVEIDLDEKTFLALAKEAHRRDITFNKLVNLIIVDALKRENEKQAKELDKIKKKVLKG